MSRARGLYRGLCPRDMGPMPRGYWACAQGIGAYTGALPRDRGLAPMDRVCEPGNFKWLQASLKMASSWPKVASSWPKLVPSWLQFASGWAQVGFELIQVGPNRFQKGPGPYSWQALTAQRPSSTAQKCWNGFFKAPQTFQNVLKLQEGSKMLSTDKKNAWIFYFFLSGLYSVQSQAG